MSAVAKCGDPHSRPCYGEWKRQSRIYSRSTLYILPAQRRVHWNVREVGVTESLFSYTKDATRSVHPQSRAMGSEELVLRGKEGIPLSTSLLEEEYEAKYKPGTSRSSKTQERLPLANEGRRGNLRSALTPALWGAEGWCSEGRKEVLACRHRHREESDVGPYRNKERVDLPQRKSVCGRQINGLAPEL